MKTQNVNDAEKPSDDLAQSLPRAFVTAFGILASALFFIGLLLGKEVLAQARAEPPLAVDELSLLLIVHHNAAWTNAPVASFVVQDKKDF